jgi:hypothetical protein
LIDPESGLIKNFNAETRRKTFKEHTEKTESADEDHRGKCGSIKCRLFYDFRIDLGAPQ